MHYFQAANFVELAPCLVEVDSQTKDQSQQLLHLPLVLRMTNPYAWQPFVLPSYSRIESADMGFAIIQDGSRNHDYYL